MKQKNRRLNKKKVVIAILLLILVLFIYFIKNKESIIKGIIDDSTIGESQNRNYTGKGQEKGNEKDGYPTVFKTNREKTYLEYKQNDKAPWAKNRYWGGSMEENGCGITCISIILSGYKKDVTPESLRKQYYPHLDDENIPKTIQKETGVKTNNFVYSTQDFNKEKIISHLKQDNPILICVWNKPKERWTTKSHYMVLLATDGEEKVYVSNPKQEKDKSKISGWYNIDQILPYIAKVLFIGN